MTKIKLYTAQISCCTVCDLTARLLQVPYCPSAIEVVTAIFQSHGWWRCCHRFYLMWSVISPSHHHLFLSCHSGTKSWHFYGMHIVLSWKKWSWTKSIPMLQYSDRITIHFTRTKFGVTIPLFRLLHLYTTLQMDVNVLVRPTILRTATTYWGGV